MDCVKFKEKVLDYLDNQLNIEQLNELTEHKEQCMDCAEYIHDMMFIKESMKSIDMEPLPYEFSQELHQKLIDAQYELEDSKDNQINKKNIGLLSYIRKNKWLSYGMATAAVVFIAIMMIGIRMGSMGGGGYYQTEEATNDMAYSEEYAKMDEGMAYDEKAEEDIAYFEAAAPMASAKSISSEVNRSDRKMSDSSTAAGAEDNDYVSGRLLIRSANMSLDVENYDQVVDIILHRVEDWGGFVSSAEVSQKHAMREGGKEHMKEGYYEFRIPQEKFNVALDSIATLGEQKHISIYSEDVTSRYRDVAAEVENLKVREKKLREIMDSATTVEDTIVVERELSDVRGRINSLSSSLKKWERLAAMSLIQIRINEVRSLEPQIEPIDDGLGNRIRQGFIQSINRLKHRFEYFIVSFVESIPWLLVYAVFIVVLFFIARKVIKFIKSRINK